MLFVKNFGVYVPQMICICETISIVVKGVGKDYNITYPLV